ncbi:MAG: GH92 family glycosyl hydrolase, partial [Bacteroidota bacterium]
MKRTRFLAGVLFLAGLWSILPDGSAQKSASLDKEPVDFVNPLMGTDSKFSLSNGNTYPAIARPWGMNFWTPQTAEMGDGWQYAYDA